MKKKYFASILRLGMIIALMAGTFLETIPTSAAPAAAPKKEKVAAAPLLAPVASVGLSVPANVMVGENFTFTASFSNTSGTATDVGYGPFIDVVLPTNGADGNGNQNLPLDGISFISASYLGNAVVSTVLTFPGSGAVNTCVDHPYAVAPTTGAALQVCGVPGDTLVVLQLPFGSFVPGQPAVDVTITASLSNLADVNTALNIRARGGYQYGATPLSDWCCSPFDTTILSNPSTNSTTWSPSPVTPRLFTVTKTYNGPEDETATGPNFPREYTVTVDIADGQTLTNLDVADTLPNNMQFVAFVGSTPASSAINTPSTATPGGTLTRRFASVTGTSATADATMTFSFYIPRLNAGATAVINAATGAPATSVNEAQAAGNWTPVDTRDTATPVIGVCTSPCHTLTDRSIATQKSVATITDTSPTGTSPGDTLEYTLDFQISDFFAFDNVVLTDVLSDGQRLDLSFTPTLQFTGNGYILATAVFAPANYTVDNSQIGNTGPNPPADGTDGTQTLIFRVSDEVVTRGQPNGRLIGGCINPTNGSNPPDCAAYNDGATTGTIVFRAIIQQNFTDTYPSGDASVDHGDVLNNDVTVTGAVLNPTTSAFTATGSVASDDSAVGLVVGFGGLTKSVYAINGSVCDPCTTEITTTGINPDDTVTYRLSYTMPASDFEPTVITDYLPLPVFFATEVTTFSNTICGVPAAGNACLGSNDTFSTLTTPVPSAPTLSTDGIANTVKFSYAAYDNTSDITSMVDLLFTVTVTGEPFADGLFLTNQANVTEGTTNAAPTAQNAIVLIKLNEPALYTTKAAVSTDNPNGVFLPTVTAPIAFNAPGIGGLSWSGGTINSDYLDVNPIDSNLSKVDAGDLVRFAIVIRNDGNSKKGAFDISIRDTFQPGYVIPGGLGLNLQIYRGDGLALTYTDLGGGIFGTGIKIDDPGAPGAGACQAYNATNGQNVIVITYDLQLDTAITLNQGIINTATLFNYGAISGGPDFTNPLDIIDTATVEPVAAPTKSIVTTSETFTSEAGVGTNGNPRLTAVGEIVRFRIEQGVPEGTVTNFRLHDVLPAGLIFLNDNTAQMVFVSDGGGGITSDTISGAGLNVAGDETTVDSVTPTLLLPDTAVSENDSTNTGNYGANNADAYASGDDVYFKFGTVNNTDRDNNSEFVVIEFNVIVANITGNITGTNRNNTATARYGASTTDSASSNSMRVRVVEPSITFSKAIVSVPSPLDAGGVIQYQITYSNGTGANVSTAMDVNIVDALASQLLLPSTSSPDIVITASSGAVGTITNNSTTSNIDILIASVPAGESVTVDFYPVIQGTITPGQIVDNVGSSTWTSLPGLNGSIGNSTGSNTPGNSGDTNGERNGTGTNPPNSYSATDNETFTSDILGPVKSIVSTSESYTSDVEDGSAGNPRDLTIGEIIRYRLAVQLTEGTTLNLQLVDTLPAGFTYLNDGTTNISFVANADVTEDVDLAGADNDALPPSFILPSGRIDVLGQDVTFTVGNLVNNDSDGDQEFVVVDFNVVVNNDANSNNTDLDNNDFDLIVDGSNIATSNAVGTRIVEPFAGITKSVSDENPSPGQIVTFTLVVINTGATTAFDVDITDGIPNELSLDLSSITISPTGTVSGVSNTSTTTQVHVTATSIDVGGGLIITYDATVIASLNDIFVNDAETTWTSLPGSNGTVVNPTGSSTPGTPGSDTGERDGSESPSLNDYKDTDQVQLIVNRNLVKNLVASNLTSTGFNAPYEEVGIGEVLTYQIVLTIPENNTDIAIITDTLGNGLAFMDCSQIATSDLINVTSTTVDFADTANCNYGTNVAVNNPVISNSGGGTTAGDIITFNLGDIVNNASSPETITLTYRVIVLDIASNVQSVTLDNDVEWTWSTGNLSTKATPSLKVIEPELQIDKTVDPTIASLGSVVTYTIEISHTTESLTTAYDVRVIDNIPAGLALVPGSVAVTGSGGLVGETIVESPTQIMVWWSEFPLLATATIIFDAEFIGPSPVFNSANVEWKSLQIDPTPPPLQSAPSVAQSIFNNFSTERRYDPGDLTGVNSYSASSTVTLSVPPRLPKTGFAPNIVTALPEQPSGFKYSALGDLWIEIPRLGIKMDIVGVPFNQEDWNLTWLGRQAGYLAGTAFPTHEGNTGLTAHAYLADGTPGPFANLDKLQYGDQIIIHMSGQKYVYEVREEQLVRPTAVASVLKHEKYAWLTLITCKSYNEQTGDYTYRSVVRAVLVYVIDE